MRKKRMRTQTVLTLSIALVTLVSITLIGLLTSIFYVRSSQQAALDSTKEIVTQLNNNISYYIYDIMNVASYSRSIATEANNLSKSKVKARLKVLNSSRDDITKIALFDSDGAVISATEPEITLSKKDISTCPWFIKTFQGDEEFYFTGPHVQRLSDEENENVITFTSLIPYTLKNENKEFILLINLNLSAISEILDNAHLPSDGYAFLVKDNGELVYHPRDKEIDEGFFKEDFSVIEKENGAFIYEFMQRDRITVIEDVANTGWKIVGVAYTDDLNEMQRIFGLSLALTILVIVAITFVISHLLASFISSPIKQLESIMRQVQKGNFDVVAPQEGTQEVQSLSSSFSIMIEKIKNLMEDIKRVEKLKRQHELDALQAKINPHFLYNTLDSIIWLAESGDKEGVVKMANSLASLFRVSIAKGHDIITIREELFHTKSYLEIQQIRYKDKFTFNIDLPQEFENCPTIKLIIQPIVENSIYHGIKMLQDEGIIDISVKETTKGDITITIADNGLGMTEEKAESLLNPNIHHESTGNGIGLRNVDERIKLTYGNKYGLKIKSALEEGTIVTITIPKLPEIKAVVIHKL